MNIKKRIHQFINFIPVRVNGLIVPQYARSKYLSIYEPQTTAYIYEHLQVGDLFLDVGAHIGYFSRVAERAGAKVIAFEPDPRNFRFLQKNLRTSLAFPYAVGERFDRVVLFQDYDSTQTSLVMSRKETVSQVVTKVFPLDMLSQKPKIIKMDIEGGEISALLGMRSILEATHPTLIIEILSDDSKETIIKFLKQYRYTFPPKVLDKRNFLFE